MALTAKNRPARNGPSLHDVFGIAEKVKDHSYIDRGGLDDQIRYALGAERHIVIHGDSKQGKTWLRSRVLDEDSFILVQCQTGSTLESLFTDALGALGVRAELRRTSGSDFEGTLDFTGSGSIGVHLLGKIGFGAKAGTKASRSTATESEPLGRTQANLWWVARTVLGSGKRLVVEDCHYLNDSCLQDLAFILKALGGYGLHVLLAGIWAQDHLLPYYNGDLVGRVEDIHLTWSEGELDAVLRAGCTALNITMSSSLRRLLITDAAGNVGLLQHLAETLCREERILSRDAESRFLTPGPPLDRARTVVANSMRQRFHGFAENFGSAVRHACPHLDEPRAILHGVAASADEQLLQGVSSDALSRSIKNAGADIVRQDHLTEIMERLADAQAEMGIRPPVLTYNHTTRKLYLADKSFLFFRRYGNPCWP